ncbi:putative methyltransferase [Aspergillus candidus]|uniref:Methyltransferase n=1 Tax=Aspergillus candidus TaxID=41067 RepID=A0A2I2FCZ9_ASPCN|nr:hypothetical protein BDW47DRAFT_125307 [Aspergillus candidus]PLB38467.1 hypothetical protein BDW47DRAFT_125307 [Aspergillus candidus]
MSTTTTTTTVPPTTAPEANTIPRGPITVPLIFYHPPPDNSTPYNYVETPPKGFPQRNFTEAAHDVHLTDIRPSHQHQPQGEEEQGELKKYTLQTHAFQIHRHIPTSTTYSTFSSDAEVQKTYYPEVSSLLLSHIPGAQKVIIFDHTIRRDKDGAARKPVQRAHVDQTAKAAAERVRLHVEDKEEAERIVQGGMRYRIVNVWRPLNGPVESAPLAFADAGSVFDTSSSSSSAGPEVGPADEGGEGDLVAVEHRYPHRTGETLQVKFNPNQRWMYLSGMEDHERLLLQCSDSEGDGVGKRVPHTAFWDPRTVEGAKPRESIEVRALVLG